MASLAVNVTRDGFKWQQFMNKYGCLILFYRLFHLSHSSVLFNCFIPRHVAVLNAMNLWTQFLRTR